jgi:hypothetical protein
VITCSNHPEMTFSLMKGHWLAQIHRIQKLVHNKTPDYSRSVGQIWPHQSESAESRFSVNALPGFRTLPIAVSPNVPEVKYPVNTTFCVRKMQHIRELSRKCIMVWTVYPSDISRSDPRIEKERFFVN